uniref:Uncharacterized protein n=1 Tax=Zooxanthella nutricula TaxID=1333877 RepID=A0A6V0BNH3_9DINO|mmetsp:Transcript_67632/g.207163  ORF Transcript_67632/g.207163 Transcript_67632/m.207163 type:complete len:394 (+) Transcript_67632:228-1409(+)
MTTTSRGWKSSTSRWKPLFKSLRTPAHSKSSDQAAEGSSKVPEKRGSNSAVAPRAWGSGALVLNGSGRPMVTSKAEESPMPLFRLPWEKPAKADKPKRGILKSKGKKKKTKKGKSLRFASVLITEAVEPTAKDFEYVGVPPPEGSCRSATRRGTGFHLDKAAEEAKASESPEAASDAGESANGGKGDGSDDGGSNDGSGFGSDSEEDAFEALEREAAANAKANKAAMAAMATADPDALENDLGLDFVLPGASTEPGERSESRSSSFASSTGDKAHLIPPKQASRSSSFTSSVGGDLEQDGPPNSVVPTAAGFATVKCSSSASTSMPAKRRDSESPSFASSSDDEFSELKASARPASTSPPIPSSPLLSVPSCDVPKQLHPEDSPRSSFASSHS